MSFKFRSPDDLSSVNYEGIKILPNSPKNPKDFQAIQDIIRYRLVKMMQELYGNSRVNFEGKDPFTVVNDTFNVNGVWYLDGYRIELENVVSNKINGLNSGAVMLDIRYDTIDFTTDTSIALQDPVSKKYIPSSQRYMFTYRIRFENTFTDITSTTQDPLSAYAQQCNGGRKNFAQRNKRAINHDQVHGHKRRRKLRGT